MKTMTLILLYLAVSFNLKASVPLKVKKTNTVVQQVIELDLSDSSCDIGTMGAEGEKIKFCSVRLPESILSGHVIKINTYFIKIKNYGATSSYINIEVMPKTRGEYLGVTYNGLLEDDEPQIINSKLSKIEIVYLGPEIK